MKKIWHPINGYTSPVSVRVDLNNPMGKVYRVVGNPAKRLFRRSSRRFQKESRWLLIASKKDDVPNSKLAEYIRRLQQLGYIHAGKRRVKGEGKLKGFAEIDCAPAGQYDEYRLELCQVYRGAGNLGISSN